MILTPSKLIFDSNYKSDFKNAAELNMRPRPILDEGLRAHLPRALTLTHTF